MIVRAVAVETECHVAVVAKDAEALRVFMLAAPLSHVDSTAGHSGNLPTMGESATVLMVESQKFVTVLSTAGALATVMSNRLLAALAAVALLSGLLLRRLAFVEVLRAAPATRFAVDIQSIWTSLVGIKAIWRPDFIASNAMPAVTNGSISGFGAGPHPFTIKNGG